MWFFCNIFDDFSIFRTVFSNLNYFNDFVTIFFILTLSRFFSFFEHILSIFKNLSKCSIMCLVIRLLIYEESEWNIQLHGYCQVCCNETNEKKFSLTFHRHPKSVYISFGKSCLYYLSSYLLCWFYEPQAWPPLHMKNCPTTRSLLRCR